MSEQQTTKGTGLRFNQGKTRHDLIPAWAVNEVAKVFTKGAEKYAERNWEKGMEWSKATASLKRHLSAFENSEDFDPETGLYHMAHVATNALFLLQYYKIFPQGDDRPHPYLTQPKIGLDIDEVLADWISAYKEFYGYKDDHEFNSWYVHYDIIEQCNKDLTPEWYSKLKPKIDPKDINFVPHCYITSRNIPQSVTEKWLQDNGFPCRPVYTIGLHDSKADVAKQAGVDIFVDDVYKNFLELNRAGVTCYLFDAPHNKSYNVGYKRIKSLKELV